MITIKLLGGARKAVGGHPFLNLEKPTASVFEILDFLKSNATEPRLLKWENLIIAINGIDSSALEAENALAKSGDTVTVVTVVHGGAFLLDGITAVTMKGIRRLASGAEAGAMLKSLRRQHKCLSIQAVNSDAVFGTEHALEILRIALEAEKRKIMLAKKVEMEFLLRLACTDQISEAIKRAGLKKGIPGCLIAFSEDSDEVASFEIHVRKNHAIDDTLLAPSKKKKKALSAMHGITHKIHDDDFRKLLAERAAILIR